MSKRRRARRSAHSLDGASVISQMIGDLIAQIVGEVVGYATGRVILSVFTPHIHVTPRSKVARPPKQGWFSLTIQEGWSQVLL